MKNILDEIKTKAKALHKKIVLCEGEDKRVVKAAADATKEGIAEIVLLGNEAEIKAANPDVDLTGVTVVDPLTSPRLAEYNAKLCELRASKGMTPDQAAKLLTDGTYFGAMMLKWAKWTDWFRAPAIRRQTRFAPDFKSLRRQRAFLPYQASI